MKIPQTPTPMLTLLSDHTDQLRGLVGTQPAPRGRYRHWDTHRQLTPPEGLTAEQTWLGLKLARSALLKPLPLVDSKGKPFWYGLPDPALKYLHWIDRSLGGAVGAKDSDPLFNPSTRNRYIVSSLINEAIRSSQLEGASTTVEVARQMLRSGRHPVDQSERMIVNNYRAMQLVRDRASEPLTPALILDIHRAVATDTLGSPDEVGAFRTGVEGDEVRVVDNRTGLTLHVPPVSDEVPHRVDLMCQFANATGDPDEFMHPVIRAIITHFALSYIHPFFDGNGRTARALFYWSMLNQEYWLFEFVSISDILTQAPAKYAKAFLYSETDDNDATYFVLFNLRAICRAIEELDRYLDRKIAEVRAAEAAFRSAGKWNHRQLALLGHALRRPDSTYTIESHRRSHDVVYQTARSDLLALVKRGLLRQTQVGNEYQFRPAANLTGLAAEPVTATER